jgi:general secretion pathway protein C
MKRVFFLAQLLLLTLIAFFSVKFFYNIMVARLELSPAPPPAEAIAARETAEATHPVSFYRSIARRDLFQTRKEPEKPAPQAVDIASLKQTDLNLKLWGTVSGEPESAFAVIEETAKREQDLYMIGDSVQNALVKMILREKVVLTVNGKDEILTMEDKPKVPGAPGRPPIPRAPSALAPAGPSAASSPEGITLRRNEIENAVQDIAQLATQVTIRPYMEQGKANGLILTGIKPDSIFRRMGLRNGDILMGVNGAPIESVDDALKLYENLRTAPSVSVQMKRRGQVKTIDYSIQ